MADFNDIRMGWSGARTMPRPMGTGKPGTGKPGTGKPGTGKPGTGKPGTGKPGTGKPGEPDGGDEAVGRAEHWIQFTERLKQGYSKARYDAWIGSRPAAIQGVAWRSVGPSDNVGPNNNAKPRNIGGRITCLATVLGSKRKLLAGAACGGLWENDFAAAGATVDVAWASVSPAGDKTVVDQMHNISALAVSPKDSGYVYCGTGHAYHAGDSFPGVGIFRSKDYGANWELIANVDNQPIPHRISSIAIDPTVESRIMIGGVKVILAGEPDDQVGLLSPQHPGMFFSEDYGKSWRRETFQLRPKFMLRRGLSNKQAAGLFQGRDFQCHSLVWAQTQWGPMILAAISGVMDWSGIWSGWYDSQNTLRWEQRTRGLPPGREFGRTSLTVSRSDSTFYAFVGAADGSCLGVFRSKDAGEHWSSAGPDYFTACCNLNYTNCIAVSPEDPDRVVCGADDLHRSTDAGRTWTQVTEWFADPKSEAYAHKDHQTLLWIDKNQLYSGNDGGVDMSNDGGIKWKNLNKGLAITMFYDIDVAPSFGAVAREGLIIAGGTQDNASVMVQVEAPGIGYVPTQHGLQARTDVKVIDSSAVKPCSLQLKPAVSGAPPEPFNFAEMLYGDGGWIVFDPDDPLHLYGSSQYMEIYRHRKYDGWLTVTPSDASDEERAQIWMAYIAMNENHPQIVFTGSTRVWRTQNDGEVWTAVSDHLDGSAISAIEIADANTSVIYVGTENGNIFKSTDGGNRWSDLDGDDTPKPLEWRADIGERSTLPFGRAITRIEANPKNANIVVATMLGFDVGTWYRQHPPFGQAQAQPGAPMRKPLYPHVIWNDGSGWKDADKGGHLPDVHHNVVTWGEDPYVFVANDVGVWMSRDIASNDWFNISGNLPNVVVSDLVYHRKSRSLVAATYGRGIWWLTQESLDAAIRALP